MRAPVRPLEPGRDRHQRGAGLHRQGSGRGDPRLLLEHLDLDAGLFQVTVADQADQAARAEPLGEDPERAVPAGQRQDVHPQALTEPDERLIHRFRPQPFRDGGERPRPARHDPRPGLLEVAHVRQRKDHAAARLEVGEQSRLPGRVDVHPGHDPRDGNHRQPEHLEPVPRVGTQRSAGQGPQFLAVHVRTGAGVAEHAAQVGLQHLDLRALPSPGDVGRLGERPPGPWLRDAAGNLPAQLVREPRQPLAKPPAQPRGPR